MKIAYVFPSRGRPLELIGGIMTAHQLRSKQHDITYCVSVDRDDEARLDAAGMFIHWNAEPDVRFYGGEKIAGLGELWNRPLADLPDIDAVTLMSDRLFPITPGWDQIVAQCCAMHEHRVLWWHSTTGHSQIVPVFPKALLAAWPDRKPYSEDFPFWYVDTGAHEIDLYLHGAPALTMPVQFAYDRKETRRARDFAFWARYFAFLRPVRIAQAKEIARRLGLPWTDRPMLTDEFEHQDRFRIFAAEDHERRFGDRSEPDDGYLRLKATAEQEMREAA